MEADQPDAGSGSIEDRPCKGTPGPSESESDVHNDATVNAEKSENGPDKDQMSEVVPDVEGLQPPEDQADTLNRNERKLHEILDRPDFALSDVEKCVTHSSTLVNAKNDEQLTPLHLTISKGYSEACKVLLKAKADVSITDKDGQTPMHYAALRQQTIFLQLLLENGATIRDKDNADRTPLHFASALGCTDTMRWMIEHSAQVNASDQDGWTALHYSADAGHTAAAELLLRRFADAQAKDRNERTAYDLAKAHGQLKVAKVIESHLASQVDQQAADEMQEEEEGQLLKMFVGTWNVAGKPVSASLDLSEFLPTGGDFDLIIVGTQECETLVGTISHVTAPSPKQWETTMHQTIGAGYTLLRSHALQVLYMLLYHILSL
jgi:ankyrin repeat protein